MAWLFTCTWECLNGYLFLLKKKKKNLATSLMYSIVYTIEWLVQERISQLIRWTMPIDPYIKLNTDGNAIGNLGLAGVWGILRDSSSGWLSGFSLNLGIATNNMAKRGLLPAWNLGFKFIQIELDSSTQLSWLTNRNDFIILIWCL